VIGLHRAPGANRGARPLRQRPGSESVPWFIAATENEKLGGEIRRLLEGLLGPSALELLPEDGDIVLHRLRPIQPKLVFLSMEMRRMEALTLIRALPRNVVRRVVLLVPDTLEGYRVAWEALCLGARDMLPTRGEPPYRFKGSVGQRLRQLACLLHAEEDAAPEPDPAVADDTGPTPWVVLAETRNLSAILGWLERLPAGPPVIVRVPEGPKMLRVARDGFDRLKGWSVRSLSSGDRLVPGQIHLVGETETMRFEQNGGRPVAVLEPSLEPPGSWAAYHGLLRQLRGSTVPLRVLIPAGDDPELGEYLAAEGGCLHTVCNLSRVFGERAAEPQVG
jgi:chemotaxis response regulator CheB